ncbi:hypothetical protein N8342_11080 [Acidimicrobiales bacterium]|nr:hypothetical protein [Acidimicrobiales bacterium]
MSGEQQEPTVAPVLAEAFGFDDAVEAMREHESGFADLYDNAKPWQRLMLSGANLADWEKVLRTRLPPEPPVVFSATTDGLPKMKMSGAVHTVDYRCGQDLNGKRCNGLVGRGFKILNSTPPTAVIVFKATVDRSTVLCSASIVIPATDTAGFQTIDMYHGTVADGHKVAQRAVLATCGRHPNLVVGIDELGRKLLGRSSGPVEVVVTT